VITLSAATRVAIDDEPAVPPDDAELDRRAARLGSGPVLAVALRRDGGVGLVELRSIGPRGATLRGVIRLGPSPEASAADLEAAVTRALRAMAQVAAPVKRPPAGGGVRAEAWYRNRWVWLAVGVVATAAALSPFVLDGSSENSPTDAALDPSALER
jgi:hypothetical protein